MITSRLATIFQQHGAVPLKSPLLRPRDVASERSSLGGPAEVLNRRGVPLNLPEDLTASFARAVGRGGQSASNLKRYDIDRVYHKAMAGGHPKESLEASFDIVQDDANIKGYCLECEAILSVSQSLAQLEIPSSALPFGARTPMWYLRLTHTRLADAILEVCGVKDEPTKRHCLRLFTDVMAPAPVSLVQYLNPERRRRSNSHDTTHLSRRERLEKFFSDTEGLPKNTVSRLRSFVTKCMPLPVHVIDAIRVLKSAMASFGHTADDNETDTRSMKRLEEIFKITKHLESLITTMQSVGLTPLIDSPSIESGHGINKPLFISLDLGFYQKRKHFHGQTLFQCIAIPSNYFDQDLLLEEDHETNDHLLSSSGRGIKIAEGGRYDDLVRRSRPPGNFGSALFNTYITAPIPKCVGVKFAVGRLVELVYLECTIAKSVAIDSYDSFRGSSQETRYGIDTIRGSLGHPLNLMPPPTQCIVASVHGLDSSTAHDRFVVASKLWTEGISCEYLAQSGVLASLLKHQREETLGAGTSVRRFSILFFVCLATTSLISICLPLSDAQHQDWSLAELCGVCAIMKVCHRYDYHLGCFLRSGFLNSPLFPFKKDPLRCNRPITLAEGQRIRSVSFCSSPWSAGHFQQQRTIGIA
jgi:histidyl-tRNA synthetase